MLICISTISAQKVVFDKKDPFTHERHIVTNNFTLTSILDVGAMANIGDTSKTFFLSFVVPGMPGVKIQMADSTVKECKLKLADGKIITGKYFGNAQAPIGLKLYNSSTYTFSESDFKVLATSEITDVKTDQGLFEIAPKNKDKIPKLCDFLISK